MAQKRKGKVSNLKKLRETVQQRKAKKSLSSMNKGKKAKEKVTAKKKVKAGPPKEKVTANAPKTSLGIERTKPPVPTVKATDVLRDIGKGARVVSKVAGPLAIVGTGAMLYDYGQKVAREKPKTDLDRKGGIDWLRSIRTKTTDTDKKQDVTRRNTKLGKQKLIPKSKLGQQKHKNVGKLVSPDTSNAKIKKTKLKTTVSKKPPLDTSNAKIKKTNSKKPPLAKDHSLVDTGVGDFAQPKPEDNAFNQPTGNGLIPKGIKKVQKSDLRKASETQTTRTKRPTYGDLDPNAMPDVYHTEMPEIKQGPIGKFIMGMLGSDEKKTKRNGNNGFRNK